jgi:hypothetical protein
MAEDCNRQTNEKLKINYAGIFKKIDDVPDLRIELENIFNSKSHAEVAAYSLLLGRPWSLLHTALKKVKETAIIESMKRPINLTE